MKKIQNFSTLDLLFALVIFILGIILITNAEIIINVLSWILGGVFGLVGIVKIISYLRRKNVGVDASSLILGFLSIGFGVILVIFPNIIDTTIRIVFGGWILFTGINRLLLAFAIGRIDKVGFKTFLITSLIMIASGIVILISFYQLLGALLVIYAVSEIINYVYFNHNKKKYSRIFVFEDSSEGPKTNNKKVKRIKQEIKDKEAIEAVIDQ